MERIFSKDGGIPPMFSETFRDAGPEWKSVSGIDFEVVGRILICHLILEHYISNLIELLTPAEFDWNDSKLTFAQKQKLIRKVPALSENKFSKGIEILNKIRNKFSHNLVAKIDEESIQDLRSIINSFRKKHESEEISEDYDDVAIIEIFTSMTCAFIAGYCSSLVEGKPKKKTSGAVKD